jgi:hypothetical protein
MRKLTTRLNPNEDPELIEEYKQEHPNHTAEQWIHEAIYVNNGHCSDDAIAVANLLYLALESLKTGKPNRARVRRLAAQ